MKILLLLSLMAAPMCGMTHDMIKRTVVFTGLATTHTTATLLAITKCTSPLPLALTVGAALTSDYLLTKYAKDSK